MFVETVVELKQNLDQIHEEAFEKLTWLLEKDDSKFQVAYFGTQPDGSWKRCVVYTELRAYVASDMEIARIPYIHWSSVLRDPHRY